MQLQRVPMLSVVLVMFFIAAMTVYGQGKKQTSAERLWQSPPKIENQEFVFDLNRSSQFESVDYLQFTKEGVAAAGVREVGSLISKNIEVGIRAPEPFLAVASIWTGDAANASDIKVSIRSTVNGKNWGGWLDFAEDEHGNQPSAEHFSNLLFLDKKTKYFQFRIALTNSTKNISSNLKKIRFILSSPGSTPENILQKIQQEKEEQRRPKSQGNLPYPKPSVTTRTAWGCPDGQNSPLWTPQYTTVTHLIVHHTATSNSSEDWPAIVRSIWNYHTNSKGWGDIGYNYLIDANGVIYEGRAGGNNVIGAHFSCANSNTMGVGMIGTFTSVSPAANALSNLEEILAWKSDDSSINPLTTAWHNPTQLTLNNLSGHRDANPTTAPGACPSGTVCPGNNLYGQLPTIRTIVDDLVNGSGQAYATLPYSTSFEASSLDQYWSIFSSTANGRIRVWEHEFSRSGSQMLAMDTYPTVGLNRNEAKLHLDLSGYSNIDFSVWWAKRDDDHSLDAIYFSNDGGINFVKVFNLTGNTEGWVLINLDVDQLAAAKGLTLSSTFVIKLQQYDNEWLPYDGFVFDDLSVTGSGPTTVATVSGETRASLTANYPNPFNPATTIRYRIAQTGPVVLRVYNLRGQLVRTLIEKEQAGGTHSIAWDGKTDAGMQAPSGNYFYEVIAGSFRQVKRMILLK